jgi:Cu(I)/Ag(I) efflux system membrane fusion protein
MLWEFPEETIDQIERSGEVMEELDFFAPVSGYVSEISITREDHINEGMVMYRIADLSEVWIEFEAYESAIGELSKGDKVKFRISSLGGQIFNGEVDFIEPFLSTGSRTVKVRVTTDNPNNRMKPGMFAEGVISSGSTQTEKLLVPRSAVMWTGKRSIVFVDVSNGDNPVFEAREVVLGGRAGNDYVIEEGLQQGEHVVTNGTFKVDAAAQLSDKLSMMNRDPGTGANQGVHNHGDMEMDGSEMNDSDMQQMEDHSGHQMQKDLEVLIPEYLKLRGALASDDFDSAREHITVFSEEYFSDIEELRAEFKSISEMLITQVEEEGYEGTLFKQYCPMFDGGSSWISDKEDIENPFYGSQMHNCGETVEQMN